MKYIKLLVLLCTLSTILNSCNTLSDAGKILRNEKVSESDAFLIKKKKPLTQPPGFEKIPKPGSIDQKITTDQDKIEKILKTNQSRSAINQTTKSSIEEFVINQIKK